MPIGLYSYKEGCRSTPKLRRNQSGYKYKHNPSVDSFTSLRPNSPGLQTVPNSPISLRSHDSWPSWHQDEMPSPAYTRFPVGHSRASSIDGIMSPLEPVTPPNLFQSMEAPELFTDLGSAQRSPAHDQPKQGKRWSGKCGFEGSHSQSTNDGHLDADRKNDTDSDELTNAAKHVMTMNLRPSQVAVIKDARHESDIMQIYDWKGNEISYTFGGDFEQFKREYELIDPFEVDTTRRKGTWKRLKTWSKGVKKSFKAKAKGTRRYEVETWCRRLGAE